MAASKGTLTSTVCNSQSQVKGQRPREDTWSLQGHLASHKKGSVHFLLEPSLGISVTSLESCGCGLSLEWHLVFPWQSTHCFSYLSAFFDILSVLQMWRFEITSFLVCVGSQAFFVSLLEIPLHPQRIPDSDIIHLMSGTLKSQELPHVLPLSTFRILKMLPQLKSVLSFACCLLPFFTLYSLMCLRRGLNK